MHENLNIRPATLEDIKAVFELSNDVVVRENSIHKEPILWETHQAWFKKAIAGNLFYIVENDFKDFVAQVRFNGKDENIISISITKKYRGQGLAADIIKECSKKSNLNTIYAYVKSENIASYKVFLKAGYKPISAHNDLVKMIYQKPV